MPPGSSRMRKFFSQPLWGLPDDLQLTFILEDCLPLKNKTKLPDSVFLLPGNAYIQPPIWISGKRTTLLPQLRTTLKSHPRPPMGLTEPFISIVSQLLLPNCAPFPLITGIPSEHSLISILFMNLNLSVSFWEIQLETPNEPKSNDYVMHDTISLPKWGNWLNDWKGRKMYHMPKSFITKTNGLEVLSELTRWETWKLCWHDVGMETCVALAGPYVSAITCLTRYTILGIQWQINK